MSTPLLEDDQDRAWFEDAASYDDMLQKGLTLSGESRHYFASYRVAEIARIMGESPEPCRILDFGCGTGETTALLAAQFSNAEVYGVDSSEPAIEAARRRFRDEGVVFDSVSRMPVIGTFDIAYVNGVFHHIPVQERHEAIRRIFEAVRPGGCFLLFENNPYSLPARLVMRRIPFDRDAIMIWPHQAVQMLRRGGFETPYPIRFFFIFPRALRRLRRIEPSLSRLPIGAQYLLVGRRSATESSGS